jgi:hypothetical protein
MTVVNVVAEQLVDRKTFRPFAHIVISNCGELQLKTVDVPGTFS